MRYEHHFEDRFLARIKRECHFGIIEGAMAIAAAVSAASASAAAAVGGGLAAAGVAGTATTGLAGALGTGLVGATVGAGLGAGEAALTGGDPGKGALGGAISGGVLSGAGGALGSTLGSSTAGNVLAGSAGGALGAAATGADPGMGALTGAGSGLVTSALHGDLSSGGGTGPTTPGVTATEGVPGGAAGGAAANAVPGSVASGPMPTESITVSGLRTPTIAPSVSPSLGGLNVGGAKTPTTQSPDQKQTGVGNVPGTSSPTGTVTGTGTDASPLTSQITGPSDARLAEDLQNTLVGSSVGGTGTAPVLPAGTDASFLDKLGTKSEDLLTNPMTYLAGAGLVADLSKGGGNVAGGTDQQAAALQSIAAQDQTIAKDVTQAATQQAQQGSVLEGYLASGTLPPGLQAQFTSAKEAAKAKTMQTYANMGMHGSSSMYADLAAIETQAAASEGKMQTDLYAQGLATHQYATNLFQQALSATGQSSGIYQDIMKTNIQADQNLSQGVNNFVSALAGLGRQASNAGVTA